MLGMASDGDDAVMALSTASPATQVQAVAAAVLATSTSTGQAAVRRKKRRREAQDDETLTVHYIS